MSLTTIQVQSLSKAKIFLTRFISTSETNLQAAAAYDVPCSGKVHDQKNRNQI